MRATLLTIPELALIAGTRVALGAGLGLLLGDNLNRDARRGAGWALFALGALTSVPLIMDALAKSRIEQRA